MGLGDSKIFNCCTCLGLAIWCQSCAILQACVALVWSQEQSRRLQEDFAAPGEQPPELALCSLGGVLAARSGQGLDRAGARVDQVAGHHATEAASHHLQRSRAVILSFGSRSKIALQHSHQGRSTVLREPLVHFNSACLSQPDVEPLHCCAAASKAFLGIRTAMFEHLQQGGEHPRVSGGHAGTL